MNITVDDVEQGYEYKKGNISSTQTIEKMFMSIEKASAHAEKLNKCVGFSIQHSRKPSIGTSREYMCHFKAEPADLMDSNQWHTYLVPVESMQCDLRFLEIAVPSVNFGANMTETL